MVHAILPPQRGSDAEELAALFLELSTTPGAAELGHVRTFAHAAAILPMLDDYAAEWDARQAIRRRAAARKPA